MKPKDKLVSNASSACLVSEASNQYLAMADYQSVTTVTQITDMA